jgi:hypothetical protein
MGSGFLDYFFVNLSEVILTPNEVTVFTSQLHAPGIIG